MTEEEQKDPEVGETTNQQQHASPPPDNIALPLQQKEDETATISQRARNETLSDSLRAQIEAAMQKGGEQQLQGLSVAQYEAALATFGYNEVVVKEAPILLQILSRYLGIVPLFVTLTAVLSVAIFSTCNDDPK